MINLLTIQGVEQAAEAVAENPVINQTVNETTENLSISFWSLFAGGGWLMWVLVALAVEFSPGCCKI